MRIFEFSALLILVTVFAPSVANADWWQDCTAERQKFCQRIEAGGGRIVACLDRHESELSLQCKAARAPTGGGRNPQPAVAPSYPSRPSAISQNPAATSVVRASAPSEYRTIFQTNWASGLDPSLMYQAPRRDSISAADGPGGRVLRVAISQRDNYAGVANGAPRAEVSFGTRVRFQMGSDYQIQWSTLIPGDFVFDSRQPEGISQIHEGQAQGTPPFSITLNNDRYTAEIRNGRLPASEQHDIGSAAADKGRWVYWLLHYVPDGNGAHAVTELFKDGRKVLESRGVPNAYPGDNNGYFKFGIYKWWWQSRPSDVAQRTLYFGDVQIAKR
jgi:hypothetical protein